MHVHTRTPFAQELPLHARIAPLPSFGSMLSETPGARKSLSSNVHLRMACASVQTISRHPNFDVLGAMCQIQGVHPSPRQTPTAKAAVPGGWIYLTREGFFYALIRISSFTAVAQSLVNVQFASRCPPRSPGPLVSCRRLVAARRLGALGPYHPPPKGPARFAAHMAPL